jgi:hypothetical protein
MRLTIRQVTYLMDHGHIKAQDFDTIAMRIEPFPSHLMLLQKAGLMTWDEIEEYEANIDWSMKNLLRETSADQQMLDKYNHKFVQYFREQLASSKIDGYPNVTIIWDKVEYNIPELVKFIYVKRLAKFGFKFSKKSMTEKGNEYYSFEIKKSDQDPNIYNF